jgi:hypothetical protein
MIPLYQPTSFAHSILALVFYVTLAGFVIYSMLALYALLRFGRSKTMALVISILYLIISAGLYAAAVGNLSNIKF